MVDRLERLTDLVLVLLRDERPKPLREIAAEVPGYPAEGEARRQAFERDKRTLRDGGVQVSAVSIDGPEQVGYLIRPEDFYLPDLELAPDEQAALNLAVAGVHLGDPSGRDALWRLGLPASAGVRPFADLTALPALPVLYDAVRHRATVTFDYRGDPRHVAPALLRFRGGWWYLVGFDLHKEAARTFRVDRMDGRPAVGEPGSAVVPDSFDPSAAHPEEPWRMGEEDAVPVDVLVDGSLAPLVEAEVGSSTVRQRRPDGSVVVRLEVTNVAMLRSWVLELGEHAEVLGPESVRGAVVSWLEATAAGAAVPAAD
ncbi:MAG TPA: WYL domain-containing protein [Acidimicrobiales bacterium]|jgi:proteasome accessory factor B